MTLLIFFKCQLANQINRKALNGHEDSEERCADSSALHRQTGGNQQIVFAAK